VTRSTEIAAQMRAALSNRADAWRFLAEFAAEWRAVDDGYDAVALDAVEEQG
jgi:hypothetical protein